MNFIPAYSARVSPKTAARNKARAEKRRAKREEFLARGGMDALITELSAATADGKGGNFLQSMVNAYEQWGSLTDKQVAATRKVLRSRAKQAAEREAERAKRAATSDFVGTVGERDVFVLTLDRAFHFEAHYGTCYGHIFTDANGNVVVYFGKDLDVTSGETVELRATVKSHDTRDGVKQTIVNRPHVNRFVANDAPARPRKLTL